uniref:Protein shisa-5 n=1 Tax=Steinernema glaseri TaxID=37863 RepID=A0A1I7XZ21_9BILA
MDPFFKYSGPPEDQSVYIDIGIILAGPILLMVVFYVFLFCCDCRKAKHDREVQQRYVLEQNSDPNHNGSPDAEMVIRLVMVLAFLLLSCCCFLILSPYCKPKQDGQVRQPKSLEQV